MPNYAKIKALSKRIPPGILEKLGYLTKFIPIEYLYGSGFRKHYARSLETQFWNRQQLELEQFSKLQRLLSHANENVPYYTDLFSKHAFTLDKFRQINDIKRIPLLTKSDIRNNVDKLVAKNAKSFSPGTVSTSGSTGKRLTFLLDQQNREKEYALVHRQLAWIAKSPIRKIASIRGELVDYAADKGRLFVYNPIKKELQINSFQLSDGNIAEIISILSRFKPQLIKGFPSAIYMIAKYLQCNSAEFVRPIMILVSSEMLSQDQRSLIESAFKAPLVNWYGASEYIVSASQCPLTSAFHLNEDFCYCEVLDSKGSELSTGTGRIVGTSLYNYSMPFIRYEQEDLVTLNDNPCPCGRSLKSIARIEGRTSDTLVTIDGRSLSNTQIQHYWKHVIEPSIDREVDYYQIIQTSLLAFSIRVASNTPLPTECRNTIELKMKEVLGESASISFVILDEVPLGEKWRHVKKEIK